jgi:hypothetical protein
MGSVITALGLLNQCGTFGYPNLLGLNIKKDVPYLILEEGVVEDKS